MFSYREAPFGLFFFLPILHYKSFQNIKAHLIYEFQCPLLPFIALCFPFLTNFDFDIIKSTNEKGGLKMKTIFVYIIVSVFARLVGDEISKWLNKHFKSNK